jgi:flagellar protein FliO/FliZ
VNAGLAPATAVPAGGLLQLTLSLIVVVALIFAITWVVKRLNLAVPRASRAMAIVDELTLGPRERLLIVRVGEAHLLLGVGASGVVPLTPLAAAISIPDSAPDSGFAARLREMMNRNGGSR